MSRFESSRFVRNNNIMNKDVLISACNALGWTYKLDGDVLTVSDVKQQATLYGEFALRLNTRTNEVVYNTFYLPNASQKVQELQEQFYRINAEYARKSLIQEFKKKGFTYKTNDRFTPTTETLYSFFMIGRSKDKNEDEPVAQIKFDIMHDGTIVTDSDYLPNDVNERAHDAMDVLEQLMGNRRVMTKKPVPSKYLKKMKPRCVNIQNVKNNE